jgi:hypothetical protein
MTVSGSESQPNIRQNLHEFGFNAEQIDDAILHNGTLEGCLQYLIVPRHDAVLI